MVSTVLDDEIVVLQSIYGESFEEVVETSATSISSLQRPRVVQYKDAFCTITFLIPADYPTCDAGINVLVIFTFRDNDQRISNENVMRKLEEIIVVNATAGKETLFDVCEYLRGKSYIEEGTALPEKSSVTDCLEDKEEATDVETETSSKVCPEETRPTTVFQSLSAADNFAAACAAANAAAEKAAADRREATSKARENQMNYPQPGETSKAYYSRQERHWMALAVATMDAESDSDDDMTDREKERRDKKRALALKKKAKELAEAAFSEATAAATTTGSLPVK